MSTKEMQVGDIVITNKFWAFVLVEIRQSRKGNVVLDVKSICKHPQKKTIELKDVRYVVSAKKYEIHTI